MNEIKLHLSNPETNTSYCGKEDTGETFQMIDEQTVINGYYFTNKIERIVEIADEYNAMVSCKQCISYSSLDIGTVYCENKGIVHIHRHDFSYCGFHDAEIPRNHRLKNENNIDFTNDKLCTMCKIICMSHNQTMIKEDF